MYHGTISDSTMYDRHYIHYTDNELGFSSKSILKNNSAFHVITASDVISNITICISNFKYIQKLVFVIHLYSQKQLKVTKTFNSF